MFPILKNDMNFKTLPMRFNQSVILILVLTFGLIPLAKTAASENSATSSGQKVNFSVTLGKRAL